MKNFIFLFTIYFMSFSNIYSQENDDVLDVIYLKNKEIQKGVIVKNALGIVTLKVIVDGKEKIIQIQHFDIDRIEQIKEKASGINVEEGANSLNATSADATTTHSQSQLSSLQQNSSEKPLGEVYELITKTETAQPEKQMLPSLDQTFTPSVTVGKTGIDDYDAFGPPPRVKRPYREWTRDIGGLRGFLEYNFNLGVGKVKNNNLEISKSVGFQFNPIFYLGAGTSYRLSVNKKEDYLPVFINPRLNMTDHETVNPYWDVKVGYSPLGATGAFYSTTLGSSFVFGKSKKLAFNLGLSYSYLNGRYDRFDMEIKDDIRVKEKYHNIGLNIGFEYSLFK